MQSDTLKSVIVVTLILYGVNNETLLPDGKVNIVVTLILYGVNNWRTAPCKQAEIVVTLILYGVNNQMSDKYVYEILL